MFEDAANGRSGNSGCTDSAALGAALLGAVNARLHPDVETAGEAAVAGRKTVEPSKSNHLYEVYVGIHQAPHDIHHRLNH